MNCHDPVWHLQLRTCHRRNSPRQPAYTIKAGQRTVKPSLSPVAGRARFSSHILQAFRCREALVNGPKLGTMDLNPTHMPPNPPDRVGPPAPARPVVKRKRTGGKIGAFKMLPSISNLSSPASRSTPSAAHSSQDIPQGSTIPCPPPSASSAPSAPTARSGDHPHQAVQSEPPQHPASFAKPPTSAATSPAAFFHNTGKPKVPHLANRKDLFGLPLLINSQATAPPPISTTSRSSDEEDSQPARFPPSALRHMTDNPAWNQQQRPAPSLASS